MKLSAMSNLVRLFSDGLQDSIETRKLNFTVWPAIGSYNNQCLIFKIEPKSATSANPTLNEIASKVIKSILFSWTGILVKHNLVCVLDPIKPLSITVIEKNKTFSSLEIDFSNEPIFHSGNEML